MACAAAPFAAAAALLVPVATAEARTAEQFAYPPEKVWNASLRLLRIDLGCRLGERDPEVGYVTFDYVEGHRTHAGAVELVPTLVDGREGVRVVVTIPAMPSYVERMILDRLGRKLVEDFGEPLPARAPTRPESTGEGGPGPGRVHSAEDRRDPAAARGGRPDPGGQRRHADRAATAPPAR
jgi:hypothetical protein